MKNLNSRGIEQYRVTDHWVLNRFGCFGDNRCGVFERKVIDFDNDEHKDGLRQEFTMRIIAVSNPEMGWEHVSVSLPHRCPTWAEMAEVKELFFNDDETVMQLHVPKSRHINNHPYCLHLWRPLKAAIPVPPEWMV